MEITVQSALDYAGVATFAASGALMAAQKRQDLVTFLFFAAITGVGGGTLRDLLIGVPVFWVQNPGYSIVCVLVAVLVWVTRGRGLPGPALLWLDAVGLAVYAVVGASKALALGVAPPVCVVMGVLTATFGGVIRDVLAGEPSVLLRREIYVSATIVSAAVFVILRSFEMQGLWASAIAVALGFGVRAGAILAGWSLPAFAPPKGRE
jgi:uncharacterized membrane protein YeiH